MRFRRRRCVGRTQRFGATQHGGIGVGLELCSYEGSVKPSVANSLLATSGGDQRVHVLKCGCSIQWITIRAATLPPHTCVDVVARLRICCELIEDTSGIRA